MEHGLGQTPWSPRSTVAPCLRCVGAAVGNRPMQPSLSVFHLCFIRGQKIVSTNPERCSLRTAAVPTAHGVRRPRERVPPAPLAYHSVANFERWKRHASASCGWCEPPRRRRSDCIVSAKNDSDSGRTLIAWFRLRRIPTFQREIAGRIDRHLATQNAGAGDGWLVTIDHCFDPKSRIGRWSLR